MIWWSWLWMQCHFYTIPGTQVLLTTVLISFGFRRGGGGVTGSISASTRIKGKTVHAYLNFIFWMPPCMVSTLWYVISNLINEKPTVRNLWYLGYSDTSFYHIEYIIIQNCRLRQHKFVQPSVTLCWALTVTIVSTLPFTDSELFYSSQHLG